MLKQFYFMKEGTKRNGFAVMNRNQNFYYSVHYFVTAIDFSANFLLACRQHTHRVVRPRKNCWHTKPTYTRRLESHFAYSKGCYSG